MADELRSATDVSSNLINFDIDELDDAELDLPAVENTPTLESILNEPDETSSVLDEDEIPPSAIQLFKADSGETSSISSQDSYLNDRPRQRRDRGKKISKPIHGSVLKPSKLKNISAQILSAADRVDAGMPTAITVSSLIAIGTSHGLVLVFDPKQVLKWCLGSTAVGAQYGAVSSLSFNKDCTRLLSGFAKGQITMWDLTTGKLLRTITDAHPQGTAVLHVEFTDSFVLAVCSDSGGSVFELEFKRLIGVRTCESQCLFSGSRGEVCVIEPLHMNLTIKDHPMQDVMVLAMASLSKVLLVTLRPTLKVMFTHPLKGDPSTLPLLAWQFVIIQVSERDRVIDPVLVFARDQTIYFYQVICHGPQDIRCSGLQKMEVPYQLLSVKWMNPRTIVTLDTSEKLHVIDVRSEEELEVIDISEVQLVYGTSYFKSLATGGNVSQALAYAGEQACYQSITSHGGQLFLQGTRNVHVFTLRTWKERLEVLVKQNKYQEALALALSFYEGKAKAVVGLTGPQKQRKDIIAHLMLDLLFNYVDLSMTRLCPEKGKIEELEEYYQEIVPVCVDYSLHLQRTDILFGRIYDRFGEDVIAQGTFLECLEPYILGDKLTSIPPSVMKDFVGHYETREMLDNVEACIVHLDITSLDIHQVVHLCWDHGLYDAIIYVYNKGMYDYTTPLEELLLLLTSAVKTGKQLTDSQIKLGNKLLVYISCCLAGRAYPFGDIPDEHVEEVKEKVFATITCLHTTKPTEDEPAYPNLRSLLQFDTREFLNVLALAFEEDEFNSEKGIAKRQRVVDILLQIMVESVGFTPTQVGVLFTFLARQMARHENTIIVNRVLFEQVLEFLSNPEDESRHEERQQALMELIHAGGLQQFDEGRLLRLAENAKFYRVSEYLYEKRCEYDKILGCYLRDPSRRYHSFSYIESIIQSERYTTVQKGSVRTEALKHLQELVSIDCKQAAQTVITCLADNLSDVVRKLQTKPAVLFEFLQGVISYRDSQSSAVHTDRQITIEPNIIELYINLMCEHRPHDVCNFIKMNEGYRLEQTLEICRKHKASEATAYLLEKAGDIQGAFGIVLENMQSKIKCLMEVLESREKSQRDPLVLFQEVEAILLVIIQLCQRNSGKMDEAGREALWFPLLENIMSPQKRMKDTANKQIIEDFKQMTHHVLNSMMGYISPPAILKKIMQDPTYNTGKFGEVKELIIGMLENYNYEQTLMKTCKNLLYHDLHVHLRSLTCAATRGFVPRGDSCHLCNRNFVNPSDTDPVTVFRCGHSYHIACLRVLGSIHVIDGEETWVCYLCSNAKRTGRLHSSRFHRSLSNPSQAALHKQEKSKSKESALDPQHAQAFESVRRAMKTPSRLAILTELASGEPSGRRTGYNRTASSIFQNETFKLKLAPPIAMELA
ncbi:vacuolar protein sorting-associated protein 8 homolog [Haliotis cracherodii]|uniref:vacuolar protein sorting-associated protein 8 homolog n=1 Tax=Haliotis cracherodii TaxID=6455 RepID=UPI0039EB1B50